MDAQSPQQNSQQRQRIICRPWERVAVVLYMITNGATVITAWTLYFCHALHLIFPLMCSLIFVTTAAIVSGIYLRRRSQARLRDFESQAAYIERISEPFLRLHRKDLLRATAGFSRQNIIGRGRFGIIYKGRLSNGLTVAIKRLDHEEIFSKKHFLSELKILGQLRHRNLLKILGFVFDAKEMAVILEFMPNGSLDSLLHGGQAAGLSCQLEWKRRLNIAVGVAHGLEYLHHGYGKTIVHSDLKPANILLDENLEPHIADFGLAKIISKNAFESLCVPHWNIGYAAPETAHEIRNSPKTDVYSFGILLLELITGENPSSSRFGECLTLSGWVKKAYAESSGSETLMDDCLKRSPEDYDGINSAISLGILCTNECPRMRPDMKDVVKRLVAIKDKGRLEQFQVPVSVLAEQQQPRRLYDSGSASLSTSTSS